MKVIVEYLWSSGSEIPPFAEKALRSVDLLEQQNQQPQV